MELELQTQPSSLCSCRGRQHAPVLSRIVAKGSFVYFRATLAASSAATTTETGSHSSMAASTPISIPTSTRASPDTGSKTPTATCSMSPTRLNSSADPAAPTRTSTSSLSSSPATRTALAETKSSGASTTPTKDAASSLWTQSPESGFVVSITSIPQGTNSAESTSSSVMTGIATSGAEPNKNQGLHTIKSKGSSIPLVAVLSWLVWGQFVLSSLYIDDEGIRGSRQCMMIRTQCMLLNEGYRLPVSG
eukprot:gb/GECG01009997.1/.p1 GENE.gb/GECG01009997.1/~~gb/GECG01009997.1/.p1  ORF type:complete len:248 (+),score=16.08 gb/GECG01009997.1/:1-744(+)